MNHIGSRLLVWNRIIFIFLIILLFLFTPTQIHAVSLLWNTFLGGSGNESLGYASASLDGNNNIYITGSSSATWGSPINAFTTQQDIFVTKLNSNGNLLWNTFLGGSGNDYGYGLTVYENNIYIIGYTSATWGTPVRAYTSGNDAFVAKLDTDGNYLWHTFLGGSSNDTGYSLLLDTSGNIYTTGISGATWGTPVRAYTSGNDAFVAKLDTDGNLVWNTFIGGSGTESTTGGLKLNSDQNLVISGTSTATWGSPVAAFTTDGTNGDAYIAKLDRNGSLTWNTFVGGTGRQDGYKINLDSNDNIYLAGFALATWGSPLNNYVGSGDGFVAKLDTDGNYLWHTFLGSSSSDYNYSIHLDTSNNVFVIGMSYGTWASPIRAYTLQADAQVFKLTSNGTLVWNTFLGGSGNEYNVTSTMDSSNNIYIPSRNDATWGTPLREFTVNGTNTDISLAKLEAFPSVSNVSITPTTGGADISWSTDISSVTQLEYGKTTGYGTVVSGSSGGYSTSHSLSLSGLTGCTNYHFRVKTEDSTGTGGNSSDYDFTTKGCESVTNDTTIQVPQSFIDTTTVSTVLTPQVDSNTGETTQKVVVIAPPQVFSFNAYLSSIVNQTLFPKVTTNTSGNVVNPTVVSTNLGILERVSDVSEVYYKTYAPSGYTSVKILPNLQTKPSILSLSFTDNYTNLKIAHSIDGKTWKILPNSIIDTKNKTVAVITKIGGYYTLVSPSQTKTTVLGTATQKPSPTPVVNTEMNKNKDISNKVETTKQNIFDRLINSINNFWIKVVKK